MCHTLQMGSIFASDEMGSNELQSELKAISQPIEGSFALIFFFPDQCLFYDCIRW